jgi:hypothetical protein
MPNTRRSRRSRRRAARKDFFRTTYVAGGVENVGLTTDLGMKTFKGDVTRTWRPVSISFELVAAAGLSCGCELKIRSHISGAVERTSGPILVGSTPRKLHMKWDFGVHRTGGDNVVLVSISQLCQTKSETDQLRWMATLLVEHGTPIMTEACPALFMQGSADLDHGESPVLL